MAKVNKREKLQSWCYGCKRGGKTLFHGEGSLRTFDCSDLSCPAQRHVQGMMIGRDDMSKIGGKIIVKK